MFVLEKIADYAKSDRIALINGNEKMTYKELERKSTALAAHLSALGTEKTPVIIYGHKEMDILPCMMGCLKAGRAYVPIDISFPIDRIEQIIEDIDPQIMIDFRDLKLQKSIKFKPINKSELERIFDECACARADKSLWVKEEDNCYIMFTSGSTGKPKGVPITRGNLESFWGQFVEHCKISIDNGVVLNQISYSFDVSVISVYLAIYLGLTLFTLEKNITESFKLLYYSLAHSNLNLWVSTPSFAELAVVSEAFNQDMLPGLEKFIFCGEVLTNKLAGILKSRFPKAKIINTYGPTEATVLVTEVEITAEMVFNERPLPIGKPLERTLIRIVDENGNQVKEGDKGELLIIGSSVSPGYYNREDLSSKVFFENSAITGERGYRTGDICYYHQGLLYYCGRNDSQIKLNGFRIEIEDIENNLIRLDEIKRAAVVPVYENGKVNYLTAFILLHNKSELSNLKQISQIKKRLQELLPEYMIPRKIILRDRFPVNTNGKVDKKVLLAESL